MNQIIKLSVSYNQNEFLIELNENELNIYDIFIKLLSEKTGEENIINDFLLMPVNTNMPYILIDENNFENILEENHLEENIKIFMNKKEKNEEEEEENEQNDFILNNKNNNNKNEIKKKSSDDFDDDFSDEDNNDKDDKNIIQKENKENINKIIEKNEIKDEIKNEIKDEIKDINTNTFNKISNKPKKEITIKKEFDNIFENENLNINKIESEIEKEKEGKEELNLFSKKFTYTDLFLDDDNNNNSKSNKSSKKKEKKQKIIFENELCMKCNSPLLSKKYICLICPNTIFCSNCELKHDHPCLIFKSKFISSLKETYNFIKKQYFSSSNTNSKKQKKNITLVFKGDKDICLRPNKGSLLNIEIYNHNDSTIFSNDILLLIKGNKLIDISYDTLNKYQVLPHKSSIVNIKCISPKELCKENIIIELFSNRYILKENKSLKINLNIEVNNDKEEENLNNKLNYSDKIIFYNKEHKKIIVSLLENELKGMDAEDFIDTLIKYNWNKEKFLKNSVKEE